MTTRPLNEYGERMARLEQKTDSIEQVVGNINQKLDMVLSTKAEKIDVDRLNSKFWGLSVTIIMILLSIVGYLLTNKGVCLAGI